MSVELDPAELGFKRPYNAEVSQTLRLHNPGQTQVAFKVKTTAPKQYCVRPNSGRISPGQSVDVSVVLQPMREDPPPDARCRDKFLVQSIEISADRDVPTWNDLEKQFKSAIQEKKIRVHYLPADGSTPQTNGINHTQGDESTMMSPPPSYTPHAQSNNIDDASSHAESRTAETASPSAREAVGTDTRSDQISREELLERLAEANAIIAKLRRENDEQGLRRRKDNGSQSKGLASGGSSMGVATVQQQTGLPIQTVAILCLIVFLFTYILF